MKLHLYLLALAPFALAGCVVQEPAPPVTTRTTVTREVTTTGPNTNEVLVTQKPPAVRVARPCERRALAFGKAIFQFGNIEAELTQRIH
jgi:hypothetical protein